MKSNFENFLSENIIKDAVYESIKDYIFCPICLNIKYHPVMCMKCQNTFCKKCIEKWDINRKGCPYKCISPNYKYSLLAGNMLSKLNFKCSECSKIINYEQVERHYLSKCDTIDIKYNLNKNISGNDGIFRTIRVSKRGNEINQIEQIKMKSKSLFYLLF